mmetsp:Transcript_6463/g.24017  ORF Transcript_6463/g.24017 Transcript_6463/m.24017 type:complete len:873 (+) Transcript_6463:273-2891(+)
MYHTSISTPGALASGTRLAVVTHGARRSARTCRLQRPVTVGRRRSARDVTPRQAVACCTHTVGMFRLRSQPHQSRRPVVTCRAKAANSSNSGNNGKGPSDDASPGQEESAEGSTTPTVLSSSAENGKTSKATSPTASSNGASSNGTKRSAPSAPTTSHQQKKSGRSNSRQGFQGSSALLVLLQFAGLMGLAFFLFPTQRVNNNFGANPPLRVSYSGFLKAVNEDAVSEVLVDNYDVYFSVRKESKLNPLNKPAGNNGKESSRSPSTSASSQLWGTTQLERQRDSMAREDGSDGRQNVIFVATRPADLTNPYSKLVENGVKFSAPESMSRERGMGSFLIFILYIVLFITLMARFSGRNKRGMFRDRNHAGNGGGNKDGELEAAVKFNQVAGVDEVKQELEEVVDYLKNPEKYIAVGAKPPGGVLMVGPPGTGKTLLAKAVAGEAEVPFFSMSASEFVELYVGMGAARVRELFARARKEAPCIIFIDEIDAVAKGRDGPLRGIGNDEREQTLNQLLTELDGFDARTSVIVLAATNRADVLDSALRRPGRFDRVVQVEAPDKKGREAILNVHVTDREMPLDSDVSLEVVASKTIGFTGAELKNVVNEAALLAARANEEVVNASHMDAAVERQIAGLEKKGSIVNPHERSTVARHEVGHALVGQAVSRLLASAPKVLKLSIMPRTGGALGFTYSVPTDEDRRLTFADEIRGTLATLLGGRAAEQVACERVSTGAIDDIQRATGLAYRSVAELGLSKAVGPINVQVLVNGAQESGLLGERSNAVSEQVDSEVRSLVDHAASAARAVVRKNRGLLFEISMALEEEETLSGDMLQQLLAKVEVPKELKEFISEANEELQPLEGTSNLSRAGSFARFPSR